VAGSGLTFLAPLRLGVGSSGSASGALAEPPLGSAAGWMVDVFSELLGSALEARAYFLLLRQKKVAKEKATPGYAVGCADSPALLAAGGGCGTRPCGPQTVLALFPPAAPLLGASHGDPKSVSDQPASDSFDCSCRPRKKPGIDFRRFSPDAFGVPLRGAEQRRRAGGLRLALSEPQASLASRPARRVAQGTGRSPAPTQGSPFLCLLSFGEAKESKTPSRRNPQVQKSPTPAGQARKPVLLLQPPIPTR
jgi:hypothetical protein